MNYKKKNMNDLFELAEEVYDKDPSLYKKIKGRIVDVFTKALRSSSNSLNTYNVIKNNLRLGLDSTSKKDLARFDITSELKVKAKALKPNLTNSKEIIKYIKPSK